MRPLALIGLIALAPLAACAERADAPLSPSFGQAVASLDSQIVNPGPPSTAPPETSAERATLAIRRYEADRVIPPATSSTSAIGAQASPTPPTPTPPSP